jgi:putative NADH-flavin reductase
MMISGCYQEAWLAGSNRSLISGGGGSLYIYGKKRCMRWQKYPRSLARDEILVLFSTANAIY